MPCFAPAVVSEPVTLVMAGARASRSVNVAPWRYTSLRAAPVGGHDCPIRPEHPSMSVSSFAASEAGSATTSRLAGWFQVLKTPALATPLPVGKDDPFCSTRWEPESIDMVG